MYRNDQSSSKRQKFRVQIRKRQIEHLFSERRKLFIMENINRNQQWQQIDSNSILMNKSLIKNQLLSQINLLLPSLYYKIKNNPCIQNIEFAVSLCANLLQDNISIQQKQQIYSLCMHIIGISKLSQAFVLVQINIYDAILATCYECVDQNIQIQIQSQIVPRVIQILVVQQIDKSRISQKYTYQQCMQQKYQGCLSALLHYYSPEKDHNLVLYYKVKRSINAIKRIIYWFIEQQQKLVNYKNYLTIVQTFNAIFGNITLIPQQFHTLVDERTFYSLVSLFINQLAMQDEKLVYSKIIATNALSNLLTNQPNLTTTITQSKIIKILLHQLQYSIDNCYTKQLLLFFKNCIVSIRNQEIVNDDHICSLLSLIKQILFKEMLEDKNQMMMVCLELIRDVLVRGFQLGNSQYRNMLSSLGVNERLQHLYIQSKNKQVQQIIDSIEYYIDLC